MEPKIFSRTEYRDAQLKALRDGGVDIECGQHDSPIVQENHKEYIHLMPTELLEAVIQDRVDLGSACWNDWYLKACELELTNRMMEKELLGY